MLAVLFDGDLQVAHTIEEMGASVIALDNWPAYIAEAMPGEGVHKLPSTVVRSVERLRAVGILQTVQWDVRCDAGIWHRDNGNSRWPQRNKGLRLHHVRAFVLDIPKLQEAPQFTVTL